MMKIKDMPKSHRPRERLIAKGPENIRDSELLAILLRTGTKKHNAIELARKMLRKYPMKKLLQMSHEDLVAIDGVDSAKAATLLAAFELTKRALNIEDNELPTIECSRDVADQLSEFRSRKKEHFVALYLDPRNRLLHKEVISVGTLNASLVHPRETFEKAIDVHAARIVIAHNHPSGDIEPSEEDIEMTQRIIQAGDVLGIDVVDHIIVTKGNHVSMRELGLLRRISTS